MQGRVVVASAAALPKVLSTGLLPAIFGLMLHMVMIQVACAAYASGLCSTCQAFCRHLTHCGLLARH